MLCRIIYFIVNCSKLIRNTRKQLTSVVKYIACLCKCLSEYHSAVDYNGFILVVSTDHLPPIHSHGRVLSLQTSVCSVTRDPIKQQLLMTQHCSRKAVTFLIDTCILGLDGFLFLLSRFHTGLFVSSEHGGHAGIRVPMMTGALNDRQSSSDVLTLDIWTQAAEACNNIQGEWDTGCKLNLHPAEGAIYWLEIPLILWSN